MRLRRLIGWDLRFLAKYGFYMLYAVLTVIYLLILFAMPTDWRQKAAALLIFSDPAAMGLFFMGAIVLLEKSQRVPCVMAVSPVKASEYTGSKLVSIGVISVIVATVLSLSCGGVHVWGVVAGTMLACVIFTLLGVIVAAHITSLNQFILFTVPVEIIGFVPAILSLFSSEMHRVLRYYPPVACMDLVAGRTPSVIGIGMTVVCIVLLFEVARRNVQKMWMRLGGVKL